MERKWDVQFFFLFFSFSFSPFVNDFLLVLMPISGRYALMVDSENFVVICT